MENQSVIISCKGLSLGPKTKIPGPKCIDPGISLFYPKTDEALISHKVTSFSQAGLLTYGSPYSLRLPIRFSAKQ